MKDERDLGRLQTGRQETTGSAPAKAEDKTEEKTSELEPGKTERIDDADSEKAAAASRSTGEITAGDDAAPVTGFSPFRAWANRAIRRLPAGVTLNYAGHDQAVTEITNDGQLRLEWEGAAMLIPFDERYIPAILVQLLPTE